MSGETDNRERIVYLELQVKQLEQRLTKLEEDEQNRD